MDHTDHWPDHHPGHCPDHRPDHRPDRQNAFRLLFAALFVMGASNSMLFVVLPMVTRTIGTGEIFVGLIFAGSAAFFTLCSPLWGSLSDTYGRRPILIIGMIGNTLSLVAMAVVTGLALSGALPPLVAMALFFLARTIYGSVGSAIQPAAQAYIADRTLLTERTKLMSTLTAGGGLGTAFGPPLAAWAGGLIRIESFIFALAVCSTLVLILVMFCLPEHRAPSPREPGSRHFWRLARDSRLWPFLLAGVGGWTAQGVFLQTLHFYLLDVAHIAPIKTALLSGAILSGGAALVFGAQFILIPALGLRPRALMVMGSLLTGFGALAMMFSASGLTIGLSFLMTALGFGLSRPGMISGASLSVEQKEQGAAAGLVAATAGAGFFIAPFTGLAVYQFISPQATYAVLAALMGLIATLVLCNRRIRQIG